MIELKIPGKPIAKKRPRFARRGKFVTTYNDQETEEGKFIAQVLQQIGNHKPIDGPVRLFCWFCMYIPASTSKKQRERMVGGYAKHAKRPDLDNLIKFVKDCLNGILWQDDSQIVSIQAHKVYAEEPMTKILVQEA